LKFRGEGHFQHKLISPIHCWRIYGSSALSMSLCQWPIVILSDSVRICGSLYRQLLIRCQYHRLGVGMNRGTWLLSCSFQLALLRTEMNMILDRFIGTVWTGITGTDRPKRRMGQQVHAGKLSHNSTTIDVGALPAGVYIVQVTSAFAKMSRRVVVYWLVRICGSGVVLAVFQLGNGSRAVTGTNWTGILALLEPKWKGSDGFTGTVWTEITGTVRPK
jgi:hypothetical protein